MRTCAIIPTYNNVNTAKDIVERALVYLPVIVVADGPTDGTLETIQSIKNDRLTIVAYKKNKGKGYALKQGIQKAKELGFTHALTMDSDGQHYPEDIPSLLRMSAIRPEAIIIGSRELKQDNMPGKNTFANRFSNFWFTIQTGFPLPDTQSGFRVYPLSGIHGTALMTNRYEAELMLLVFSSWANTPIVPVPIRVYYPPKEQRVSYFKPFRDFTRISILNTFLCLLALIYGLPRSHWRFFAYVPVFLATMLSANIICAIYTIHPSPAAEEKMRKRLSKGARLLLTGFPACRFIVNDKSGNTPEQEKQPCVFVANHTSMLDVVTMLSMREKMAVIGQNWVVNNIFFGPIARAMGVITVKEGIETYLSKLEQFVHDGFSITIFPEGTRSINGELLRFHRGACFVSEKLNIPIQPVLLEGYIRALPKKPFHVGAAKQMKATILPQISPDDSQWGNGYRERTKQLKAYFYDLIDHSNDEE